MDSIPFSLHVIHIKGSLYDYYTPFTSVKTIIDLCDHKQEYQLCLMVLEQMSSFPRNVTTRGLSELSLSSFGLGRS